MSVKHFLQVAAIAALTALPALPAVAEPAISVIAIQQKVLQNLPGDKVIEVSRESVNGQLIYTIDLASGKSFLLNALTGAVVKSSQDSPEKAATLAPALLSPKVSIEEVQNLALQELPNDTVQEVSLEFRDGKLIYTLDMASQQRLILNADTGAVLSVLKGLEKPETN
ncbi:MAG: hypothetical protein HKM05_04580 [Spirochaetales bacterium]|nr:hypothetical protein [Spirochaetales bacterium]